MGVLVVIGGVASAVWMGLLAVSGASLDPKIYRSPRRRLFAAMAGIFLASALLYGYPALLGGAPTAAWSGLVILSLVSLVPRRSTVEGDSPPDPRPFDERDHVLSRMHLAAGSPEEEDYYRRRPDRRGEDETLRSLPAMGDPATPAYHPGAALEVDSLFAVVRRIGVLPSASPGAADRTPAWVRARAEEVARGLGAVAVGVSSLRPGDLYSHAADRRGDYGEEIVTDHTRAIVFAVEMDADRVEMAPSLQATVESASGYLRAAVIGSAVAEVVARAGGDARLHRSGDYQLVLPPLAARAGLGEIGMMGLLVTESWGPRIRLGAVTTDIPLAPDSPGSFGLAEFCRRCGKCALNCPGRAIARVPGRSRGTEKWEVDGDACYAFWRRVGSDCGLCLRVCPYGRAEWPLRNLWRRAVRRRPSLVPLGLAYDDLLYARRPRPLLPGRGSGTFPDG